MTGPYAPSVRRALQRLGVWLALAIASSATAAQPQVQAQLRRDPEIDALRARYIAMQGELGTNAFGRPLAIESTQETNRSSGDVYAVVRHEFARLQTTFVSGETWCDILILHLNVKLCRAAATEAGRRVVVYIGTKHAQQAESATRVTFDFDVQRDSAGYLRVALTAGRGPLGTHDYRIVLDAVPLEDGRAFVHLTYAYSYGAMARVAMQAYLATTGRDKVGFSVIAHGADGRPVYVADLRGVVERNAMRYFLAVDAYLNSLALPRPDRLQSRLRQWFASTEQYALQLHEIEEREYMEMKQAETGAIGGIGLAPPAD